MIDTEILQRNMQQLQRNLQQNIQSSTGTRGIRVTLRDGQVVLNRELATDAVAAERAESIVKGSVPKEWGVVNAMNVAGPQQVMLEVRFLEVARSAGRDLGVNLFRGECNGTNIANTGLGSVTAAGRSPIGGINTASGPLGTGGLTIGAPPTGSLPVLGTIGSLIGTAGGAAPAPFGSLLTSIIRTSGGGIGGYADHCIGNERFGSPTGRTEFDGAFWRRGALPGRR